MSPGRALQPHAAARFRLGLIEILHPPFELCRDRTLKAGRRDHSADRRATRTAPAKAKPAPGSRSRPRLSGPLAARPRHETNPGDARAAPRPARALSRNGHRSPLEPRRGQPRSRHALGDDRSIDRCYPHRSTSCRRLQTGKGELLVACRCATSSHCARRRVGEDLESIVSRLPPAPRNRAYNRSGVGWAEAAID